LLNYTPLFDVREGLHLTWQTFKGL